MKNLEFKVLFLDDDDFSYLDFLDKPLGGAQSAFFGLVNALHNLGYKVEVRNNCKRDFFENRLNWCKLDLNENLSADLFIVNRSASLLALVPKKKPILFWLHNRANYLLKFRNLKFLFLRYPTLIFSGNYHKSSFYLWPFFKFKIIPYGLNDLFLGKKSVINPPVPRAIFSSNPLRSLCWLVDQWILIKRRVPNAELHVFSGPSTYGSWGESVAYRMEESLQYARRYKSLDIIIHNPVSKRELIKEIQKSRIMLYRGDVAETFCLSIAESLELGIPCVTMNLGSMKERIQDGVTGFVCERDEEFIEKAVHLLSDDTKWKSLHRNLINVPVNLSWEYVAKKFIE